MISSRTPEGCPMDCPVCGQPLRLEPSSFPMRDAPCPHCGCLLSFSQCDDTRVKFSDANNGNEFGELCSLLGEGTTDQLVLDLGDVQTLSSAAIGALVLMSKRTKQLGVRLRICNVTPSVLEFLQLTQLTHVLSVSEQRDEG